MQEIVKLLIGVFVLIFGIPLGTWLSRLTKEELKGGRLWFKLIISLGLIGGIVSLIFGNDVLLFSFLFIAIVTSRSLVK